MPVVHMLLKPWVIPVVLAATGGNTSISINGGVITQVVQFGFLGAVFLDLVAFHRFFVTRWTSDREMKAVREGYEARLALQAERIAGLTADLGEMKDGMASLTALTQEKMIPALVQATDIAREHVMQQAIGNGRRDGS